MTKLNTDEDHSRATNVLAHSELEDICLSGCSSESNPDAELKAPFHLHFKEPMAKSLGIIKGHLHIESNFQIEGFDSSELKALVFRCSCRFRLIYHLADDFKAPDDDLQAFARAYGAFNGWPYMRETVQDLTRRMGLHPPPLPLLRMGPNPKFQISPMRTHRIVRKKLKPSPTAPRPLSSQ